MSDPLLSVRSLQAAYGDVQVLFDVSLEVRQGEIVTLLGSNGAGKTTTLRTICGLLKPRAGEVRFGGTDLSTVDAHRRASHGIALSPEGRELWPMLSVRENLELGAYSSRARLAKNLEHVFDLFPRLRERSRQLAGSLSGGEQQMCAIGRALMSEPKLLLLDEPSLGLSPLLVQQLFATITRLHSEGMTILLVEQNLRQALQVAHRGYVIETGRVTMEGPSATLAADPAIRSAYLGL